MELKDKLNLLFEELDCTNADISKRAGIHPSGISRFRTGERIPTPKSSQLLGICEGITQYANETNTTEKLSELCSAEKESSTENIAAQLFLWLFEGSLTYPARRPRQEEHFLDESPGKFFSDKLNLAMNKLNISNSRMAYAIHVSASVISRLRNRVRFPTSDENVKMICNFLYDQAEAAAKIDVLSAISDMPPDAIQDKVQAVTHLVGWLSGVGENQNYRMIESFLGRMDSFTPDAFPPLPPLELIAPVAQLNDAAGSYHGIDGLRKAVVRFLGNASKREKPVTLMLYSDQSMNWMIGDPEYRKVWAALMVYTLRAKNRVKIIHNIDRSLPEMVHAIEGWLPLYMSGLVEAYTHKKGVGGRFSHTLFIAPGHDAVVSFFPCGMEDESEYRYIIGSEVEQYVRQHEAMIMASTPIVRVFPPGDTKGLLLLQRELADNPGELCRLLSAPAIETMSDQTLKLILDRAQLETTMRRQIEEHHARKKELNAIALNAGSIREYIFIPEGFQDRKIPLNMGDLFLDTELYYTEKEYRAHLADMRILAEEDKGYSYLSIKESVFDNMQIVVKPDVGGLVIRSGLASILSSYWHSTMANAYHAYITELMNGKMQEEHGWK